ncbi:hypothetical protein PUNSTDRAFT_134150 [Punctularia strigosozonata HHB-11173 SS5]|uniref:uncharacterized protein n=1 Tax=Punctularia strigosozonata (strain HHB-11173) TaxID=741275 RepID=UPI00044176C7|nr:uncharacterized protein PUNSTDRAFT_134150 [Punctularia strigosozonata HHB-11173 SS5]EIN08977.1 hypothetical protein PUNSTDRAFT_134150 [Punctularia strigosozonata HHB-11173 SS5]
MFMRVPVEELSRSQICFRFNEADGGLSYEVRPLPLDAASGDAFSSSAGSTPAPAINFQTIFDEQGRGRGLSVFASVPHQPRSHVPSPPASPANPHIAFQSLTTVPITPVDVTGLEPLPHYGSDMCTDKTQFSGSLDWFAEPANSGHLCQVKPHMVDGLDDSLNLDVFGSFEPFDLISDMSATDLNSAMHAADFHELVSPMSSESSCCSSTSPEAATPPTPQEPNATSRPPSPFSFAYSVPEPDMDPAHMLPSPPPTATSEKDGRPPAKTRRKRYACLYPNCDRLLTSEYTRRVHMTTHTKVRKSIPCTMPGCMENFSRMHDRLRHEVTQHGKVCEFSCHVCKRFFSSAKFLGNHKCPGERVGFPSRWPATGQSPPEAQ